MNKTKRFPLLPLLLAAVLFLQLFLSVPVSAATEPPVIDARAAVLMDAESGDLLYSLQPDDPVYAAGLTVMMTALLAAEAKSPDATIRTFGDALWYSLITMTTVGYGDVYPVTAVGRFFAAVISLVGIGIIAIPTGIIAAGFSSVIGDEQASKEKKYCPYCGKKIL